VAAGFSGAGIVAALLAPRRARARTTVAAPPVLAFAADAD
jgi:hypothetical protein